MVVAGPSVVPTEVVPGASVVVGALVGPSVVLVPGSEGWVVPGASVVVGPVVASVSEVGAVEG
ncbi:hypothetical protein [Nannocystis pusilla]|uniref:hypothetical protein n=1 Tax=Nannocystis pusilla TaxID=889268 RepID=UPI003B7ACDF0